MTLFYYNPLFLEHDTGQHPEHATRLRTVIEQLKSAEYFSSLTQPEWMAASTEQLLRVHSRHSIDEIESFFKRGGGQIEADTVVRLQSMNAARTGAGAACDAVQRVLAGEDRNAFCLIRPPGHHAEYDKAMGFCIFNNVAVGANYLIEKYNYKKKNNYYLYEHIFIFIKNKF
mgnify:CR=1 FL=1